MTIHQAWDEVPPAPVSGAWVFREMCRFPTHTETPVANATHRPTGHETAPCIEGYRTGHFCVSGAGCPLSLGPRPEHRPCGQQWARQAGWRPPSPCRQGDRGGHCPDAGPSWRCTPAFPAQRPAVALVVSPAQARGPRPLSCSRSAWGLQAMRAHIPAFWLLSVATHLPARTPLPAACNANASYAPGPQSHTRLACRLHDRERA